MKWRLHSIASRRIALRGRARPCLFFRGERGRLKWLSALCGAYLAATRCHRARRQPGAAATHSVVALQPEAESEAGQLPRLARHSTASFGWKRGGAWIEPHAGVRLLAVLSGRRTLQLGVSAEAPAVSILGASSDSSDRVKALFTQAADPAHLLDENVASHTG